MGETWENSDLDLYIFRKEYKQEVYSKLCENVNEVLRNNYAWSEKSRRQQVQEERVHRNVSYEPVSMFCIIRHENDHDCYIYVG